MLSLAFFGSCGKKKAKDGRTDTPTSGTIQFVADDSLSLNTLMQNSSLFILMR